MTGCDFAMTGCRNLRFIMTGCRNFWFVKDGHFYSYCSKLANNIVLINGCFHYGQVICPRFVIMVQWRLYWPEATPRSNTIFRGPLWLNRRHITGPLWKYPFLNTFRNFRNFEFFWNFWNIEIFWKFWALYIFTDFRILKFLKKF